MKGESLGTARRGRGKERSNRTIGPREILARSPVPSPRARAHARRYLAQRDKSLVPHVIKSFSRSRGSKGKERRTLEKAGREAGGWHTTDLDSAALCASVDDKGRSGGRTGGKRRLNGVKPRAGGAAGREGAGGECLRRGGTHTDIHHRAGCSGADRHRRGYECRKLPELHRRGCSPSLLEITAPS